jgi:hypothetical protein
MCVNPLSGTQEVLKRLGVGHIVKAEWENYAILIDGPLYLMENLS